MHLNFFHISQLLSRWGQCPLGNHLCHLFSSPPNPETALGALLLSHSHLRVRFVISNAPRAARRLSRKKAAADGKRASFSLCSARRLCLRSRLPPTGERDAPRQIIHNRAADVVHNIMYVRVCARKREKEEERCECATQSACCWLLV